MHICVILCPAGLQNHHNDGQTAVLRRELRVNARSKSRAGITLDLVLLSSAYLAKLRANGQPKEARAEGAECCQ